MHILRLTHVYNFNIHQGTISPFSQQDTMTADLM